MFNFSSGGFDFGNGGSAKRTKYLRLGVLALIVAASLAFIIWHMFIRTKTP